MKILYVIAMEKEAKDIAKKLELSKIEQNIYKNENISLLITGIGKQRTAINLTKYLEENGKPDMIINIGYVGSTNTPIGTWINVNKSYNYEWNIPGEEKYEMPEYSKMQLEEIENKQIAQKTCYSAEGFVTSTQIKEDVIFDMELHSIYLICQIYKIKLLSLKKVSDNLSLDEYYKNIETKGIFELTSGLELI